MTAFKSILVPMADAASGAGPLEAALALAGRFGSHVSGLHVRIDPAMAVPLVGEGMSGAMMDEMISVSEAQAGLRAAQAKAVFDSACARHGTALLSAPSGAGSGASAEWIDQTGREDEVVAWRGRLADLLVFAHPGPDAEGTTSTLNTALMACGRPLLMVPAKAGIQVPGRHVAIAWNGSAEAARAVGGALPLLREAGAVTILSAAERLDDSVEAPAGELAAYLAWHGIAASAVTSQASAAHAGEELLRQVSRCGADMLVMGAYTHSRLRQLILGGVTRHVIANAAIPVLMCH